MGLGLLIGGLRLGRGDQILTTAHDHYAAHESIRYAAERSGASVRRVELYPPEAPERATTRGIVSAIEKGLGRSTRLVVVTWVHSSSGVKLPVREIAEVVARANRGRPEEEHALLFVDAAHGLGAGPAPVAQLGCDALIAGCHKWLLGPRGTGVAWASPKAWDRIDPVIPSFDARLYGAWTGGAVGTAPPGAAFTPGGFHSFEHRWALNEAFELHEKIGSARIEARVEELSGRLREGLARAPKVRLHVPAEERLRSGVVCYSVPGRKPDEVVQRMFTDDRVHASVTPYGVELARLGACWLNTESEIDRAVDAVRSL